MSEIIIMEGEKRMLFEEVFNKLIEGNKKYLNSKNGIECDISLETRLHTATHGQHPYAVIITCSDSRVIPESIFSAGIGELFVIRVAGNVISNEQLGSIEYAVEHLDCKTIIVLGHDHCGAVKAAINDNPTGHVKCITDKIKQAIGTEKDELKASWLNVHQSVSVVQEELKKDNDVRIVGAIYHIEDGRVEFDI